MVKKGQTLPLVQNQPDTYAILSYTESIFQTMDDDSSRLPIALRRTPRLSAMRLHVSTSPSQRRPRQHAVSKSSHTPKRTKKIRPSDSDSIMARDTGAGPLTPPTTGRQRSAQRAIPTTERRKYSKTPSLTPSQTAQLYRYDSYWTSPGCDVVRIFPLRAVLDDRVKRRIRRNGLSEEMNTIYSERKQRAKKSAEEVQHLRDQLAAKELENDLLRDQSSLLQDTSRILELERQISDLRQGLHGDESHNANADDWDMAAADAFTDSGSLSDIDDRFPDDTTLEVESASSLTHEMAKSYTDARVALTPPHTSPLKSASPDNSHHFFPAPRCDVGVQATFGDAGQAPLEDELMQLRCELASLQKMLEPNEQLECQLNANIASTQNINAAADVDPDLQLQTDIMLQTLAEKTAALANLNSLVSSIGSPKLAASEVVSALRSAFQAARQELEQIFPHDKSLSMSLEGTVVLGDMLRHLRDSAAQAKKDEALLEEYYTREQQLREQLNDRMDAMGTMTSSLREKDDRIFRLEAEMERFEAVIDGYRKSLAEASLAVEQKDGELMDVQANLESMISVAAELQAQLAQVQVDREIEKTARKATYEDLTRREMKILELHKEITALKEALVQAQDSISKLQGENDLLQSDADRDKKAARDTVSSLRTQLLQSLQMSEAFLA